MILRLAYLYGRQWEVARFLAETRRCREVQREVLLAKIRRNAQSDFGRQHGFSKIQDISDFRSQIPVATYEYYRPWVERVKNGEIGALFGPEAKVLMFAVTSGTTNASKYIPITSDFLREYRRSWNVWGLRAYRDHVDLLRKKTLQISSDWQSSYAESGIPCGNISGLAAEMRPFIARPAFILPTAVNKVSHPTAKQYTALRVSLTSRKVGMIITANPLTLIGLARLADERRESLIRDLFDGTLSREMDVPEPVRRALQRRLRPRPARARELERIVERTGTLYPRDFWPQLTVLAVWTGGSVGVYIPKLKDYYGETCFRDHGLSATEGRMTTPLRDGTSAGILDIVTHYFEFIPEEEHDGPNPTVLEAHELEEGKNYFLVLTTSSGIYRHDIHDVVRCVGFEGTTPVLDFLNKGAHYCSMTGEKLSEIQVVQAVRAAFWEKGISLDEFTLAPCPGDPPRYRLLAESIPDGVDTEQLAGVVDRHLSEANCEYANRIETGRLRPVVVERVPPGTWAELRRRRLARTGGSLEQYKHPCLVNHPAVLQGVVPDPETEFSNAGIEPR